MSVAVCLKCGAQKWGALTPCAGCGHRPSDPEDQARHVLAVEGIGPQAAKVLGAHIASGGGPAEPDPAELADTIEALSRATPLRVALWGMAVGCGPILVIAALLAGLAWVAESL